MVHKNLSSWFNFLSLYYTFILKYFYYFRKPSHKKSESEIVMHIIEQTLSTESKMRKKNAGKTKIYT